ncbi:wsc domain-containing protein [Colletotrichum sojae]|uniref:Wsc domain-containing protein n=1 Tax=Colletotrichum sojae TaxID=2175907 RepID=A0A8H6IZS3_9PEZI|nr:wsc domain-containing protein [Colletotrichum sojae]
MARNLLALLTITLLLLLSSIASAQTPTIYTGSDKYKYQGCFNETTDLPGTARERALSNGANQVVDGNMTVPLCLSFCSTGTDKEYTYAGIEYSRECWCSQHISSNSAKFDDSACNMACDGNKGMVCGGAMKLSVYMIQSGSPKTTATAWGLLLAGAVAVVSL